jgi:DNA polymerase-3 subunit alpha
VLDSSVKVAEYIGECRDMGIRLLPPDVNASDADFTVSGDHIRFGLVAIKGIGRGFIDSLMRDRAENGPYTTLEEFCRRLQGKDFNRRAVESLIKAGAFDSLGFRRHVLMAASEQIINAVADDSRKNIAGQLDLFGLGGDEEQAVRALPLPDIPEYSRAELMAMERETTGLYLSGHPMDDYRDKARRAGAVPIASVLSDFAEGDPKSFRDNQEITLAGIVASSNTRTTRNNSLMCYIMLEDDTGAMELIAFQRALDRGGQFIQDAAALLVRGRISLRDEKEPQLMVDSIRPLSDLDVPGMPGAAPPPNRSPETGKPRTLYVRLPSASHPLYRRMELLLSMFPGNERMMLYFEDTKKRVSAPCLIHDALVQELTELCGGENVVVK